MHRDALGVPTIHGNQLVDVIRAQGYVHAQTGANIDALLRGLPDGHGWDFASLSGHIVDYCKANPDAPVHEAAISLASVLQAGKVAD